jgi:DnaJ-class molecular chaperone
VAAVSGFDVLGLPESSTADAVRARWKELRSELHPDRGGDAAEFDQALKAYEQALAAAEQPMACQPCGGTGRAEVRRGFSVTSVACGGCGGTGEVQRG